MYEKAFKKNRSDVLLKEVTFSDFFLLF